VSEMTGPVTPNSVLNLWRGGIIWPIALVLLWGCSDGEPPASSRENPAKNLRLVIKWPGDDLASKQDLELRDKIEQQLATKKIGKIVRSGTGMGWMDIVLEVDDQIKAREEIKTIVKSISPEANFEVQVE
jgi:hypothetical protein